MKISRILILILLLAFSAPAQTRVSMMVKSADSTLQFPTNFFVANSNLLNQAIAPSSGGGSATNIPNSLLALNGLTNFVTLVFTNISSNTNLLALGTNGQTLTVTNFYNTNLTGALPSSVLTNNQAAATTLLGALTSAKINATLLTNSTYGGGISFGANPVADGWPTAVWGGEFVDTLEVSNHIYVDGAFYVGLGTTPGLIGNSIFYGMPLGTPGNPETIDVAPPDFSHAFSNDQVVIWGNSNLHGVVFGPDGSMEASKIWWYFTNVTSATYTSDIGDRIIYADASANNVQITLNAVGGKGETTQIKPAWTFIRDGAISGPQYSTLHFIVANHTTNTSANTVSVCLADHSSFFDLGTTNLVIPLDCQAEFTTDAKSNIVVRKTGPWPSFTNGLATITLVNTTVQSSTNAIDPGSLLQAGATTGQALAWNGSKYAPATISGGAGGTSLFSANFYTNATSQVDLNSNGISLNNETNSGNWVMTNAVYTNIWGLTGFTNLWGAVTNIYAGGTNYIFGAHLATIVSTNGIISTNNTTTVSMTPSGGLGISQPGGNKFSVNGGGAFYCAPVVSTLGDMIIVNSAGFMADAGFKPANVLTNNGPATSTLAAPSVVAGAGAGTSPTLTCVGSEQSCLLNVTTGSSPSASSVIATGTYAASFPFGFTNYVQVSPCNATTAAAPPVYLTCTSNTWALNATTALTASTAYQWSLK